VSTRYPREMHRIKYTKLTPEQIGTKLVAAANGPSSASPLSDALAGKSLKIVLDGGPPLSYRFADRKRLSFAEGDAASVDTGCGALTLDRLVLFSHMIPRTQRGYTVVIDQERIGSNRGAVRRSFRCARRRRDPRPDAGRVR